ncbi:MAG: hypothetical protein WAN11_17320 [Syntrophobacteraceae bacterium]
MRNFSPQRLVVDRSWTERREKVMHYRAVNDDSLLLECLIVI